MPVRISPLPSFCKLRPAKAIQNRRTARRRNHRCCPFKHHDCARLFAEFCAAPMESCRTSCASALQQPPHFSGDAASESPRKVQLSHTARHRVKTVRINHQRQTALHCRKTSAKVSG